MEHVIKESLQSHLTRNSLKRKTQHGFMQNKSCTTNLLEFLETATKLVDEGKSLDIIYLDFAKAFDLVPRLRLIEKLKAHGVGGGLLKWISAWLSDRKQRVVLNGKASSWVRVTSGVPQGSILGPILFAIFINDLDVNVANKVDLLSKFADDTKVGHAVVTVEDSNVLQAALDTLCAWADKWQMRFNVDKCHVIHVGKNNKEFVYHMNGVQLAVSEQEKDIGVLINNKLKPTAHCEKAARTAAGVLGQILRAFSFRDRRVLPKLYAQYVRPHMEFAVQAWAPWSRGDTETLENVQKRLVKAVTGLKEATYEDRCKELGLDTLAKRRQDHDMVQTFKIIHGIDNVDRATWFTLMDPNRSHRTRLAEGGPMLVGSLARLELRKNFFSQRVVEHWNRLPVAARTAGSVAQFKNLLKTLPH